MKFQHTILSGLRHRYYSSANKVLRAPEADRKLDIFLTSADAALPDGEHDWSNVLVIGEHKQNPDEDGSAKTLVHLAGYAREVFWKSTGAAIRAWVYDLRKHDAALGIRQIWTVQLREVRYSQRARAICQGSCRRCDDVRCRIGFEHVHQA
ncbi:hypothetical protein DL98DRAFT_163200 [Cadophora sp. DSE1049]|nr:hypothetical protein DL98DRAFT_163200 [Cadophora sp. DSE1049]